MKHLYRTAALALVMGSVGFAAHAQDSGGQNAQNSASQSQTASSGGDANYCDRQWTAVDGNEDGFVTEEEVAGAIEERFNMIDADGNGEITKTEYVDCKASTKVQAATAGRDEETFQQADANSDDSLSRQEFGDAAASAYEEVLATNDTFTATPLIRRYIFLTPVESEDASTTAGMSADEAAARSLQSFTALDTNDDDMISMSEWNEQQPTSGMSEEAAGVEFSELNADSNDTISREEYRSSEMTAVDKATKTGSTNANASGSASGGSDGSASASGEANANASASGNTSGEEGVPVFLYWFH